MKADRTIHLENDLREISRMAEELELFCSEEQLPSKTGLELTLVLEELVTNIISYGYRDEEKHIISIRIEKDGDTLSIVVEDDGVAFNPLDRPTPELKNDLDQLEPGGLGIHLVRNLTDEISYRRDNNRNIITFKKKAAVL